MTDMEMHPYLTKIPSRSFDIIYKNGWLSEALLALVVDPMAAEDVEKTLERVRERITIVPDFEDNLPYDAPIRLADFKDLGSQWVQVMLETMAQWVMYQEGNATAAIGSICLIDRRIAAWCACSVAREGLRVMPPEDDRPMRAIVAIEEMVKTKRKDVAAQRASDASNAAARRYSVSSERGWNTAGEGAYGYYINASRSVFATATGDLIQILTGSKGRDQAAMVVDCVAYAIAYYEVSEDVRRVDDWGTVKQMELMRLREVIAKACLSFPG
jgi:hypothetical protein